MKSEEENIKNEKIENDKSKNETTKNENTQNEATNNNGKEKDKKEKTKKEKVKKEKKTKEEKKAEKEAKKQKKKEKKEKKETSKFVQTVKRKWLIDGSRTLSLVLLILAAFLGINTGMKVWDLTPIDLSQEKLYTLTDESKERVKNIDKDVHLYFVGYTDDNADLTLAKQYKDANERIVAEAVDSESRPDLVEKYGIQDTGSSGIIVECGDRSKVLTASDLVTDAVILSRYVDSTIIVAAYKTTKIEALEKVKKEILNVGGKIAGVVINKMPISTRKYYGTYYYGSTNMPSVKRTNNKKIIEENIRIQKEKDKQRAEAILKQNREEKNYNQNAENKNVRVSSIYDFEKDDSPNSSKKNYENPEDVMKQMNDYLSEQKKQLKKED